jgi:DNA polymerase-3 subunit gamma/tau
LNLINYALDQGTDARQYARQMVEYLRLVMLAQTGGIEMVAANVGQEALDSISVHAQDMPRRTLLAAIKAFNNAATDASSGWQPQLPLELALVESVEALYEPQPTAAPARQAASQQQTAAPAAPPIEAAPAAGPEEASPDSEMQTIDLAQVNAGWNKVLETVHQMDLTVEALLNSGKLLGIEGSTVVYQMPSDLLRDKMETDANLEIIETAMNHIYGLPLQFRCQVTAGADSDQSDEVDGLIASDEVISFAVNELGGNVTNIEENEE